MKIKWAKIKPKKRRRRKLSQVARVKKWNKVMLRILLLIIRIYTRRIRSPLVSITISGQNCQIMNLLQAYHLRMCKLLMTLTQLNWSPALGSQLTSSWRRMTCQMSLTGILIARSTAIHSRLIGIRKFKPSQLMMSKYSRFKILMFKPIHRGLPLNRVYPFWPETTTACTIIVRSLRTCKVS